MGRKIFISYKYSDSDVKPLGQTILTMSSTTVRSYVDKLEEYLRVDNIYKGESDDEDLSNFSEDLIWNKLKDRIYDSSVTIVMISKRMKQNNKRDRSQWIPWEISFSLRETTRNDRTSYSNAMLAVVLPDSTNSYQYFMESTQSATKYRTDTLFSVLGKNMFNKININYQNGITYDDDHSYIHPVKWDDFILYPQTYIDNAVQRKNNISQYNIVKVV